MKCLPLLMIFSFAAQYSTISSHETNGTSTTFEYNFTERDEQISVENYINSSSRRSSDGSDYSLDFGTDSQNRRILTKDIIKREDFCRDYSDYYFADTRNSKEPYDLSNIRVGDIIVEACDNGHAAMVYDTNKLCESDDGEYSFRFIETIEACMGKGVVFGFLDRKRIDDHGVYILRTNWSQSIINNALHFCDEQLGKNYYFPIDEGRVNTSINSEYWYCTELIYAAFRYSGSYYNLGGISPNGWIFPRQWLYVSTLNQIQVDNLPTVLPIQSLSTGWQFRIINPSDDAPATINYNRKMCFANDAINWQGLRDVSDVYLSSNSYADVTVSRNFLAGCCAFSVLNGVRRYTAKFDNLHDGLGTFNLIRNKLKYD